MSNIKNSGAGAYYAKVTKVHKSGEGKGTYDVQLLNCGSGDIHIYHIGAVSCAATPKGGGIQSWAEVGDTAVVVFDNEDFKFGRIIGFTSKEKTSLVGKKEIVFQGRSGPFVSLTHDGLNTTGIMMQQHTSQIILNEDDAGITMNCPKFFATADEILFLSKTFTANAEEEFIAGNPCATFFKEVEKESSDDEEGDGEPETEIVEVESPFDMENYIQLNNDHHLVHIVCDIHHQDIKQAVMQDVNSGQAKKVTIKLSGTGKLVFDGNNVEMETMIFSTDKSAGVNVKTDGKMAMAAPLLLGATSQ